MKLTPKPTRREGTLEYYGRAEFEESAELIRQRTSHRPTVGMILGSGLSGLVSEVSSPDVIPYAEIPHFPVATVAGHIGELVIGRWQGHGVAIMRGRAHFYEGYSLAQATLPLRAMRMLGVDTLIVTNAAGGLNPQYQAGDLMLLVDHMNLMGMGGQSPLRGPNDDSLGPRFPDMTQAYDLGLRGLAKEAALELGVVLREGVYVMLAGPAFETPAEIRFLRMIGADAVGMSTVHEVIAARHAGMRTLGFSLISNTAIAEPQAESETTHEEVLEAGKQAAPRLTAIIRGVLRRLQ